MIELLEDSLSISFPEVHPNVMRLIDFQRTLRIPDDDRTYPLPPGLGRFPLRHVDDYPRQVPAAWQEHGGVLLPMYQAEALWINFNTWPHTYPCAVKVATGKINAITGGAWTEGLHRDPQDYLVTPNQPWLDGYCVAKGAIRQFVAMPLGAGYSVEEQLTGAAEHGGMQIEVYPMKADVYVRRFCLVVREESPSYGRQLPLMDLEPAMGFAAGGRMRQEISEDPYDLTDWDLEHRSRCFVHLANATTWHAITGEYPPGQPPTAQDYARLGLPWFEYYGADQKALAGAQKLQGVKGLAELGQKKGQPLPANDPVEAAPIIHLQGERPARRVREGTL